MPMTLPGMYKGHLGERKWFPFFFKRYALFRTSSVPLLFILRGKPFSVFDTHLPHEDRDHAIS